MLELYRLKATRLEILYAIHRFAIWSRYVSWMVIAYCFGRLIRLGLSHWLGWRPFSGSPLPLRAALGWLLIVAICLLITAPFSTWFRYFAYWTARHWRGLLVASILLPLATLISWSPEGTMKAIRGGEEAFSIGRLFETGAVLALVYILGWVIRARNSTYIGAFEDYTGDTMLKEAIRGAAPLLENQLGRIRLLYAASDDSGALTDESVFRTTINVQNVGESLKAVATAESKVKLGPLEIPIGATLGLLAEISKGPRLFGSVHQQDGKLLVIAGVEGGRFRRFDWRVGIDDLEAADDNDKRPLLERMIEQLACRVFTDLGGVGSPSWRAVDFFSRGLDSLRKTSRTKVDKYVNLRSAERAFITALAYDSKFWRCHYNLGVAYKSLGQQDAALASYRKALEVNPAFSDAYYALGSVAWDRAQAAKSKEDSASFYREVLHLCDQAVALDPLHALAWTSRGIAQRRLAGGERRGMREALQSQEIASAVAWNHVCKLTAARRPAARALAEAKLCLQNLAVCHSYIPNRALSVAAFRQAIYVTRGDTTLWFEFGKVLFALAPDWFLSKKWAERKRYRAAAQAFTNAAQSSGTPLYWAHLAEAQLKIYGLCPKDSKEQNAALIAVLEACDKARDTAALGSEVVPKIKAAYETVGKPELRAEIDGIVEARQLGDEIEKSGLAAHQDEVSKLRARYPDSPWIQSQLNWFGANANLNTANAGQGQAAVSAAIEARRLYESVIADLKEDHPQELMERGAYAQLSYAYDAHARALDPAAPDGRSLRCEALRYAQYAVAINPIGSWERCVLAYSHFQMEDSERASQEWSTALDLAPGDQGAVLQIAQTCTKRAYGFRDQKKRMALLRQTAAFLERLLLVAESQFLSPDSGYEATRSKNELTARIRFTLGWAYRDLLEYDLGIAHLIKAKAQNFKPLELSFTIGSFYKENKSYNEADNYIEQGIQTLIKLKDDSAISFGSKSTLSGEEIPMVELLARLYMARAYAYAGRGVKRAEAEADAERARQLWKVDEGKPGAAADKTSQPLETSYHEVKGWIALQWGSPADAIAEFQTVLDSVADPDVYFGLTQAYCAQAEIDGGDRARPLAKARAACQLTEDCDSRGYYRDKLIELRARIEALSKPNGGSKPDSAEVLAGALQLVKHATASSSGPAAS